MRDLLVVVIGLYLLYRIYVCQTIEGLDATCAINYDECNDDEEVECVFNRRIGCDDEEATNYQQCVTDPDNELCQYPIRSIDLDVSIQRGVCQGDEYSTEYASCQIPDSRDSKPSRDSLYVRMPSTRLSNSTEYMYSNQCPQSYADKYEETQNARQMGQFSGYTPNQYIDRIRFYVGDEPLPTNPDFFMDKGGTYA